MPEYIKAMTMAWERVEPLRPELMPRKVIQLVNYCYLMLHGVGWAERQELLDAAETAFAKRIAPYMRYYWSADPDMISESYEAERGRMQYTVDVTETVDAWLDRLGVSKEGEN